MAKERLDKLIASTGRWSRREVKTLVREGRVLVDGRIAGSAEEKYDAESCRIAVNGEELVLRKYTYVMLHKPAGVLSATEDGRGRTVLDLLTPELRKIGVFPVGRLDKDTEGRTTASWRTRCSVRKSTSIRSIMPVCRADWRLRTARRSRRA